MSFFSPGLGHMFITFSPPFVMVLFSSSRGIISPTVPMAARSRTSVRVCFGRPAFFLQALSDLESYSAACQFSERIAAVRALGV